MKKIDCCRLMSLGLLLALFCSLADAGETIQLIDKNNVKKNWTFGNGPEFPGAKGGLEVDNSVAPQRRPALRLDGNFTGGGNYVQTGLKFPAKDIESLSFWIKAPKNKNHITMRLIDGTGQCHQINYKINPDGNWQQVNFPVEKYFEKAGSSSSVEAVVRYEGWGGAKDGKWHNPAKALYLLCGRGDFGEEKKGSIFISGVKMQVAPEKKEVIKEARLDDFLREGEMSWSFNDGREFPGAKGGVTVVKDEPKKGEFALSLKGDFTGGGAYIDTGRGLNGIDFSVIKMQVKTPNVKSFNVRLIDGTKQCHQAKGIKLIPDNKWHDVEIKVKDIVGGEHWGGANDGKWHPGGQSFHILIGSGSAADKKPEMLITDIRADSKVMAAVTGESYQESFDNSTTLPKGWSATGPNGSVSIIKKDAFDGSNALRVSRTEDQLNDNVQVTGAAFTAAPGPWNFTGATRSELNSPDSSFAIRLNVDALNGNNQIERITVVDQTGKKNWKPFSKQIELPKGTTKARFSVMVHKTFGFCDIDALSATPLAIERQEKIVDRIEIGAGKEVVGNMFLPEDEVKLNIDVQSVKPLPKNELQAEAIVTDYWGAEQFPATKLALKRNGVKNQRFCYSTSITVPKDKIEIGKYYELHVNMPLKGYEDASEYSAFARLPEAESRKYKPEEIPFTIRSWDNRIGAYMELASRIGHRNLGVWGGWDKNDPNKVNIPTLDLCRKLGNNWVTGTPASDVERNGFKNYSEENLRQGMTNFLKKYADQGLAYICLGNEPNEKPEKIPEKVKAYKAVYEAVKAFDPKITVIATSVPALDHFFEAGFQNYCDAYDFHVYETYEGVRNGVRRYKELGKKYKAEKPIFCTELGLNSQGQTRYAVAKEVVKKITALFAEGGVSVSWFGIQYPDTEGKARGTSGDAHNTFDCKYNKYNPRLAAIMYYNMINGITVKKFVDEVQHKNGVQDFLFRDKEGNCLQVLWHEGGRIDQGISLPGVNEARLIRIDGSSENMTPDKGVITLGLSGEPVMLRYKSENKKLAKELALPTISVGNQPFTILKGKSRDISVSGPGLKANELVVKVPPRWTSKLKQNGAGKVICTVSAPELTDARTGRIMIQRKANSGVCGELIIPLTIMSPISVEIYATAPNNEGNPGIRVCLTNNGAEKKPLSWAVDLTQSFGMEKGAFKLQAPEPVKAYLKGENEGQGTLEPGEVKNLKINIIDSDPQTIYKARVNVTDDVGRKVTKERLLGGFATAAKTATPAKIDGVLDEAFWATARPMSINEARQVFQFKNNEDPWKGADDLSAKWRAAWDDKNLYLAVEVKDDIHKVQFADGGIWNQDGLQFLFDPTRIMSEKAGKYDYSVGKGTKGEQAWCHLSAHNSANTGEAKEFKIAVKDLPGSAGGKIYEIAIPWTRLAPFKPASGENLGMSMILNEDDGPGREGFMGWFSGVHSKQLDLAGDLILTE